MAQEIVLACGKCAGKNPRPLPYHMARPDACDHCKNPFRTWLDIALMEVRLVRQTKVGSFLEAAANTAIGFVIAWIAQTVICWAYSIPVSAGQQVILVFWMTIISVVRSYAVRRIWERRLVRGH